MTVTHLKEYILQLKRAYQPDAALNGDEGVLFGEADSEVTGVLTCWMATVEALQAAAAEACSLILCHEQFYFYPYWDRGMQPQHLAWHANRRRTSAAAACGLTIMRVHGSLDLICIYDDFALALGLGKVELGRGWNRVFPIPETTFGELTDRVKQTLGLKHVRAVGDPSARVKCVGLPWGGLALDSNIPYMQGLVELGADVFVAGEADEYGFVFAADSGIPLIETGHAVSESIGLRNFAARLRRDFPNLKVVAYENHPFDLR